jgi:hypothetical protein
MLPSGNGITPTAGGGVVVGDRMPLSGDGVLPMANSPPASPSPPAPSLSSPVAKEISDRDAVGNVGGVAGTTGLGEIVGPPEGISPSEH